MGSSSKIVRRKNQQKREEIWVTDIENKENCMLQYFFQITASAKSFKGYLAGESFSATKTPSFWDPKD